MLPVPTLSYLALFTGRDESTFSPFADQALTQATLLFSILTGRDEFPDDADGLQLGLNAILEVADRIYLEQPYATVVANPFSSETIGSYTYSKTAQLIIKASQQRQLSGLFWWDLAIEELSLRVRSFVDSGSVTVFDKDDIYTNDSTEERRVFGPADFNFPDVPFDVNAETYPRHP